jgi:hypothetical protein
VLTAGLVLASASTLVLLLLLLRAYINDEELPSPSAQDQCWQPALQGQRLVGIAVMHQKGQTTTNLYTTTIVYTSTGFSSLPCCLRMVEILLASLMDDRAGHHVLLLRQGSQFLHE